jgi:hypothetical protein
MAEVIKINDNLWVDAQDFYDKVIAPRNVKIYEEDPNIIEE